MRILLVNADDLGLCRGVNEAILEAVRCGTVNSVSAFALPGFDFDPSSFSKLMTPVGIHFSLNLGSPASSPEMIPSLLDGDSFRTSGHEESKLSEIRKELLAQYEFFIARTGLAPSRINFHKHLNETVPAIQEAALEIAESFSLPMRSKSPDARRLIRSRGIKTNDHFLGDVSETPFWTLEKLGKELASLPEGETELMCHPGRNTGKIPGLWYLEQRDTEADTFASEQAKQIIRSCNARGHN